VDNFTHSLVGLAAAKAGLERVSPYATAVCVLAANLPDADLVTLFAGRYVYLEEHRGVSHSIVGTLVLSVVFPLIFYGVERLLAYWRGREPRAKLKGLLLCSLALGASHPLLDWTNNYGVRPLLPWDARWLYGDLVFILDPWIWLLLGGAGFILTAKTARKTSVWAVLGLVLTALILFLPGQRDMTIPLASRAVWVAGVAVLVLAYRFGVARRWGAAVAAVALLLVVCYWGALSLTHSRAFARAQHVASQYAAAEGASVLKVAAMPMPADPLTWRCAAETERATYRFDVSLLEGDAGARRNERRYDKPRGATAEAVRRAADDPRARVFLGFSRFPVATARRGAGGETIIQFVDIRFTEPSDRARSDSFTVEIPVAEK
jgi:inner membrane protein